MAKKNDKNCESKGVEETVEENLTNETENSEVDEISKLQKEIETLKDNSLRQFAEFDNFRKRTQKEKSEIYTDATIKATLGVLNVIDNFERALGFEGDESEFKKGMTMIFNQLQEHIKSLGIVEIEALNKPFNPDFHNAVNKIEDDKFGENEVCQVFLKGYMLNEKVIRHAMVVVAN
jgi:molecular chaperone GrpE